MIHHRSINLASSEVLTINHEGRPVVRVSVSLNRDGVPVAFIQTDPGAASGLDLRPDERLDFLTNPLPRI